MKRVLNKNNSILLAFTLFWLLGIIVYLQGIHQEDFEFQESIVIANYGLKSINSKIDVQFLGIEKLNKERATNTYCLQKFDNGVCRIHGTTTTNSKISHERAYSLPTFVASSSIKILFFFGTVLEGKELIVNYMFFFLFSIFLSKVITLFVLIRELDDFRTGKRILLFILFTQIILNLSDRGMGIYNIDRLLIDSPNYNEDLKVTERLIFTLLDQIKLMYFHYEYSSFLSITARGSAAFIFGILYFMYFKSSKVKYLHLSLLSLLIHSSAVIYLPFILGHLLMRNKKILKKYLVLGALFFNIQFLDSRYIIITSLIIFFVMIIMLYISEKSIDTTSKKNQSLILIIIIFGYYIAQLGYIIYVSQNGYPIDIWISSGFRELTGRTVIAFQPLIFLLTYIIFKKLSAIITRKELRPQSNPANPIS